MALKAMTPDLIVLPTLPLGDYETKNRFSHFMKVTDSVIIGPGLGREMIILEKFEYILDNLSGKVVVADADYFWFISHDLSKYREKMKLMKVCVMTPNIGEFCRLFKQALGSEFDQSLIASVTKYADQCSAEFVEYPLFEKIPEFKQLMSFFDNPGLIIVLKHKYDMVFNNSRCVLVKTPGSLKRCGGLGDLLCGVLSQLTQVALNHDLDVFDSVVLGCHILKHSSYLASKDAPLSLIASDLILVIPRVVNSFLADSEMGSPKSDFLMIE